MCRPTGTTTLITSSFYFGGTTYLQPGATIKFGNNANFLVYGSVVCSGTSTSPTVFTSSDDDLYGEAVRMFALRLQPHEVDDVHDPNLQLGEMRSQE